MSSTISSSHATWLAAFPSLAAIQEPAWLRAAGEARMHLIPVRRRLFADHELNKSFLLVLSGRIQIYRAAHGREITLNRLGPGDVCFFNALSQFGNFPYPVTAIAETDVEMASIPSDLFQHAFSESPAFRQYILQSLARRVFDIMQLLEGIVFQRLDVRLAQLLLAQTCDSEGCVSITHSDLAKELGSSREVISRLLKEFERKTWISLARGEIRIQKFEDLHNFVQCRVPLIDPAK